MEASPTDQVTWWMFSTLTSVLQVWPLFSPSSFAYELKIAGLSLLGYPGLVDLDPVYCMPASVIEAKGLRKGWKALERRNA